MSQVRRSPASGGVPPYEDVFTPEEMSALMALNRLLHRAYVEEGGDARRQEALRLYLDAKPRIAARLERFGIVNNRIFLSDGTLTVPYLAGDDLSIHRIEAGETHALPPLRVPIGTIITDALLQRGFGFGGVAIDLEQAIFDLEVMQAVEIRLSRFRDMGALLGRINRSTNRNESVYALRFLVAKLCSPSFKGFLGAKNLQPELHRLIDELRHFVNTPLARRVPLLVRILVRNISGIVGRPGLIDSLWNDSIDINEKLIPGSDIATELRRSTHHALGDQTLRLARSYQRYLDSGETIQLERLGYPEPAVADEAARKDPEVREVVDRMVRDLDRLLGTSEVVEKLREWQAAFRDTLFGCEGGHSIADRAEAAIELGVRARNRWLYYQHLRALRRKAADFAARSAVAAEFALRIEALLALEPDEQSAAFDAAVAEAEIRAAAASFTQRLENAYLEDMFPDIEKALDAYARRAYAETAGIVQRLRRKLADRIERGGFHALRYHLYQLDCLLEEMSYLALRHIATHYEEHGVQLRQCLEIIEETIQNLAYDGLYSREVADLASMLANGNKTFGELSNVMETLQRNYHKSLQRITAPYQKMQERLGLDDVELRITLANMQRYLHDHNSMVNFCDLARSFIRHQMTQGATCSTRTTEPPPDLEEAYDFPHLADRVRIRDMIENPAGAPNLRERFGGKGSALIYLSHLNIATRAGFILPTTLPRLGLHDTQRPRLRQEIQRHLRVLESEIAARGEHRVFGDPARPLLLAVRGGSVFPMPGILSTVVFVGMNDAVASTLARDDAWHAYDSYRRFLASFGHAVWGIDLESFSLVPSAKRRYGVQFKNDLPWEAMKEVADESLAILRDAGHAAELDCYLEDLELQLLAAVRAVFDSWSRPRAQHYRKITGICDTWQTAATVQQMASGNYRNDEIRPGMDETRTSLTGVIPRTEMTQWGVRRLTGEIKFSAAGDDLVGGTTSSKSFQTIDELGSLMPMLQRRLKHIVAKVMRFMGADQELEFTVERGVLSVLQTRSAEMGADQDRTPFKDPGPPIASGIGIRGGGFRGRVAFDESDRSQLAATIRPGKGDVDGVLVVIENPTPNDIPLILSADALLTAKGGNTSHAAVAIHSIDARDYSAVMSATGLKVTAAKHEAVFHDADGRVLHRLRKGDVVSIHGTDGSVFVGARALAKRP